MDETMDKGEQPERVCFEVVERPNSYFFEMGIRLGERIEWIGGSRAFVSPEDAVMRAALCLLAGAWNAEARMPAENDDFTLSLRALPWREHPGAAWVGDRACELVWSEVDEYAAVIESRRLGVVESVAQLAEAALELGEAQYAGRAASAALTALRSAVPALKAASPEF